jgi:predicted HAD superfamily phosphohydrolase
MLDLNLSELENFTDEELILLEEMGEMLEEMSQEEIDDFVEMIEIMGKKKKEKMLVMPDRSDFYH